MAERYVENVTPYMESVVEDLVEIFKTFYSQKDFEKKVSEVQEQQGTSSYIWRKRELKEMCAAIGVDCNRLCDKKTYKSELKKVPSNVELCKRLLKELHKIYLEFPTSGQFMERVVRRILDGEFANDSVRLAIVKRFVKCTEYHTKPIIEYVENKFTSEEMLKYQSLTAEEQKDYILSRIDEEVFDILANKEKEIGNKEWLNFIIERIEIERQQCGEERENPFKMSEKLSNSINNFYKMVFEKEMSAKATKGILDEVLECIGRDNSEDKKDQTALEEIIKSVEKEFCDYLKNFKYTKSSGKVATRVEKYDQAKMDFRRAHRQDCELLELADNLAAGKFIANGVTRERLYIFAMAFDMKCYSDKYNPKENLEKAKKDLEKNLFEDYYNDNLLRYILDEEYIEDPTKFEAEPSGEGINYKNYVEIVYLYFIGRDDLDAGEKIRRAQKVIDKCVKKAKEKAGSDYGKSNMVLTAPSMETKIYKQSYMDHVAMIENDTELIEYICENYYIYDPAFRRPRILFASEQNTAKKYQKKWVKAIEEKMPDIYIGRVLEFRLDIDWLLGDMMRTYKNDEEYAEIMNDKKFIEMLRKLDAKLYAHKNNILNPEHEARFSRREIITIYCCYYYYMNQREWKTADKAKNGKQKKSENKEIGFAKFYKDFPREINNVLEECRYQKLSSKNIFDVFVIFFMFASVNEIY